MRHRTSKRLLSSLLALALLIGLIPASVLTTFAREIIPANSGNSLNMRVDANGKLIWDDVSGATGYTVLLTKPNISQLKTWTVSDSYLNLVNEMDGLKFDSGEYILSVSAKGVSADDTMYYFYTSRVDKMESPNNLMWIGDKAAWDAVEGAAYYNLTLYDFDGQVFTVPTTDCLYDFSGNSPQDGWTFRVQACSDGKWDSKRNSDYVESPAKTSRTRPAANVNSGNGYNMRINNGSLLWDAVPGATGYTVMLTKPNVSQLHTWNVSSTSLNLTTEMDGLKFDSGNYTLVVKPKGVSGEATMSYYYTSHVDQMESPNNLLWIGSKAAWDAVEGASYYNLTLYNLEGKVFTVPTSDCLYDFSGNDPQDGWHFQVQACSSGTWNAKRNSTYTESPARDSRMSITGISLEGVPVPEAGAYAGYLLGANLTESTAGKNKYEIIDNQDIAWQDEAGRHISYSRYYFEEGRTYSVSFYVKAKDGYKFASTDISAELYNLYPYQYTSKVELSSDTTAHVTFTFEVDGERNYPDIDQVAFYQIRDMQDGDQTQLMGVWGYNNSEMTDRWWEDSNGNRLESGTKLVGGNSYSYNFVFTAFDGYHFADKVLIRSDGNIMDWEYSFNADKTKIYIKIPYNIKAAEVISSVTINGMPAPTQGNSTRFWDSNLYLSVPDGAGYKVPNQTKAWYEIEAEYSIDTQYQVKESSFIVGKDYKLFLILHAEDEYKFASPENVTLTLSGIPANSYSYICKQAGSEGILELIITFTAQFPGGAGSSESNPAICSTYAELKFALEHPDIRYIRVDSFQNSNALNYYILTAGEDYQSGQPAITVPKGAKKDLTLNADINLRATQIDGRMYSLIYNCGELKIHGTGSLNVSFNAAGYISAIVLNDGYLETTGITLDGTNYSFDRQHGYAIVNYNGTTVINGGTYIGYKSAAVSYDRGSLTIYGGTFRVKAAASDDYALNASGYLTAQEHDVNLYGGTYEGLRAAQTSGTNTPKLYNLLSTYGYFVKSDGTKFTDIYALDTKETLTVKLYSVIDEVNLTTTAPKEGKTFSNVLRGDKSYSVVETDWLVSDSGESGTWKSMQTGEKFVAGKYYKVYADLKVAEGYAFQIDAVWDPEVTATLNGYNAVVTRTYDQVADERITIQYTFGICNKTVIESVIIENVVAPVVGEYPTYTCSYAGTGYGYYTDVDNGTYKVNGIVWYDVTDGGKSIVWYNDSFVAGHKYTVEVTARVQDGYNFDSTVFSTVNGDGNVSASVKSGIWCTVSYTFTCQPKTFNSIAVTDLDIPVDGANPDFSALTDSEYYTVESIIWYDYENDMNEMTAGDIFVAGNRYWLQLTVVPTKNGSANNAKFVSGKTVAKLNGVTVEKSSLDSWQEVSSSSKVVTIFYTFECASTAGAMVSGSVTSFNDALGDITLQLFSGASNTPSYEITVQGNTVDYSFENVAEGTYTLRVSKANHVTREYTITVSGSFAFQDAMICLKGDTTGDGKVNMKDWSRLYDHISETNLLTGYALACADVTGDGKVNMKDWSRLYDHISETNPLW